MSVTSVRRVMKEKSTSLGDNKTAFSWDEMDFWRSGEWQVCQERLDDLDKKGTVYCPKREALFASLDAVPFSSVRVAIIGQDPYPDPLHATGVAFSIPSKVKTFPVTLKNIFKEYSNDLHYPEPKSGDLTKWVEQGVLLWNVYPSCLAFTPMSHQWVEWEELTKEIITRLGKEGVVIGLLGGRARSFVQYIEEKHRDGVVEVSHPSPRGVLNSKLPFIGSRFFTSVNDKLTAQGLTPINWRL